MPHSPSYRRILNRMGYYNYQRGLIYNRLDQNSGWDNHLSRCREFIMKALDIEKPQKVTVLGSGWLMELPLAEMSEKVKRITLIDIIHPPEVIEQTAGMGNVAVSEEDVSGGLIEEVWKKAGGRNYFTRLPSLGTITVPEYQPVSDPGMIVSVNLLTQLEALPEKLLRKKSRAGEEEFIRFRKQIQEKHIKLLLSHPSVLITDTSELVESSKPEIRENKTLLCDIPGGRLEDEWTWDFDLHHGDYNRTNSQFRIIARLF